MIEILPSSNDDLGFISIIEKIVKSFISDETPKEVYVTKINNWFDFKWRAFAGKILGAAGFWERELLRIPPFNPERVLEYSYFEKIGESYEKQDYRGLHIYQSSSHNITGKRRLVAFGDVRMFFWFSGNTKNTLQGNIMLYRIGEDSFTLYASFLKKKKWQIYKTDGISKQEILSQI